MKIKIHRSLLARTLTCAVVFMLFAASALPSVQGQGVVTLDSYRRQSVEMLDRIKQDIRKNYYDPKFNGIDLDAHFKATEEKVKAANSIGEMLGITARALMEFNDSHTGFIMPAPADDVEQGWVMQMIGDKGYVIAVKPKSDAEAKGLKPGDEIISFAGSTPTRDGLWKLWYFWRYQPGISLMVKSPGGQPRPLNIMAKTTPGKAIYNLASTTGSDRVDLIRKYEIDARLHRHRYVENKDFLIWKMPAFDSKELVGDMMEKAKKRKALILDLRGNPGGYEDALLRMLGSVLDHDVKVGDIKSRTETKPLIAKTRGSDRVFKGQLIVLLDSESGSSAEVFARTIQLEKRGTVIGDRSSGKVMRSLAFFHRSALGIYFEYGTSVTIADLIMSDGKSLERLGVTPDELLVPTAADMAAQRDPVLSRAAALAGIEITPEKAGEFFPVEWRP
jgi:C-terminal processing protease CtpA/Prc